MNRKFLQGPYTGAFPPFFWPAVPLLPLGSQRRAMVAASWQASPASLFFELKSQCKLKVFVHEPDVVFVVLAVARARQRHRTDCAPRHWHTGKPAIAHTTKAGSTAAGRSRKLSQYVMHLQVLQVSATLINHLVSDLLVVDGPQMLNHKVFAPLKLALFEVLL